MSNSCASIDLLFGNIGDKKISGSQPAGYRMKHFVGEVIFFLAFWIVG